MRGPNWKNVLRVSGVVRCVWRFANWKNVLCRNKMHSRFADWKNETGDIESRTGTQGGYIR